MTLIGTETSEVKESVKGEYVEGYLNRYQIAVEENVPVESPLMASLLATLPQRAHRVGTWADAREEYWYVKSVQKRANATNKTLSVSSSVTMTEDGGARLLQRLSSKRWSL